MKSPMQFPPYQPHGAEELQAVVEVMKTGQLSPFLGKHDPAFHGGPRVQELEARWAEAHGVNYAVAFNSATSALIAGLAALRVSPGDEVLVVGYSMCISASAPLLFDAIPVFVDIEPDCFCMDPAKIEAAITRRTKAILPVDLFGQSADMPAIRAIAEKHGLRILNDASHVPACRAFGGYAGTLGDIGVYSLNQHKIIHCGEGGLAVTNDGDLALRLKLLRNHAEAVVGEMGRSDLEGMVGGNYRLGELEAAIAIEQLKKLKGLLAARQELARRLAERLNALGFLRAPKVRETCEHSYYLFPVLFDAAKAGMDRQTFVFHLKQEGYELYRLAVGYVEPLHLLPLFQKPREFRRGYPWNLADGVRQQSYASGLLPVTERLHNTEMLVLSHIYPPLGLSDMDRIADAFAAAAGA